MSGEDRCLEHDPPAVVLRVWEEYGYPAVRPSCSCLAGATSPLFGVDLATADELDAGRAARDRGIAVVEGAASEEDQAWRERVDVAIAQLARTGDAFSVDDVRRHGTGEPSRPNLWGGRFLAASRAGRVVRVGTHQSGRKARHASTSALWQGAGSW